MTYVKIALAIALLIGGYFAYNHAYDQGKKEGSATVQAAWDADKAAVQKTADDAVAKAAKEKETALADNEGVILDLQTQLTSARGLNTQLADSLRQYQARAAASSSRLPQGSDRPAAPAAATGPSMASLNQALGDALNECRNNYLNYSALIKELTPQL